MEFRVTAPTPHLHAGAQNSHERRKKVTFLYSCPLPHGNPAHFSRSNSDHATSREPSLIPSDKGVSQILGLLGACAIPWAPSPVLPCVVCIHVQEWNCSHLCVPHSLLASTPPPPSTWLIARALQSRWKTPLTPRLADRHAL